MDSALQDFSLDRHQMGPTTAAKMKILVLTKRQYMGKDLLDDRFGRFREIPLEMAQLGHEVAGLTFSYRARKETIIWDSASATNASVKWESLNVAARSINRFRHIIEILNEFRPDVIWACSDAYVVSVGVWLARRTGTASVVDLYDNFESFIATRVPGVRGTFRRAVRAANGVTCVSSQLAEHIVHQYDCRSPVLVLENAVRADLFLPLAQFACRTQLNLPLSAKFIGTAGALTKSRGIDTLFNAFRHLAEENPDIHLAVAGPRSRWARIPVDSRLHDFGLLPLDRVPTLINALDVAVICNRDSDFARYNFPQKAYEILACRKPLLASSIGTMKQLLKPYPECLFEPDTTESLVRAIRRQLAKPVVAEIPVPTWHLCAKRLAIFFEQILNTTTRKENLTS
jgi:teichuronic acid biosynthesis glycosyltransferase TuaC